MTQPPKSDEFSDKVQRGGGSFPIQKIMLQIFGVILRENNDEFSEKGGGVYLPLFLLHVGFPNSALYSG